MTRPPAAWPPPTDPGGFQARAVGQQVEAADRLIDGHFCRSGTHVFAVMSPERFGRGSYGHPATSRCLA